jgi:alkanesulfonate monooxygenase SsuD/methylene tetrahydromethanopterin reductase-like flavin-dependent oxidoreductase (luciferase family)
MKLGVAMATVERSMQGKTPTFHDLVAAAQTAEQVGLDSFWLADHLLYRFAERGEERGSWEAMTMLSALAAVTTRISLGPLVAATSFRNPALLAKMADTLDEISAGRFILGVGAGWHQPEYAAFGYPFDHLAGRFEEALQIIVPLLREGHVDFQGQYYQVHDCVLRPRGPSPAGPRICIGAKRPRMLRLVAQYADIWNTAWHSDVEVFKQAYQPFLDACAAVGRDHTTIEVTSGIQISLIQPGEQAFLDEKALAGSPEELAERLQTFADAGVDHLLVMLDPFGVPGIERFSRVVESLDKH